MVCGVVVGKTSMLKFPDIQAQEDPDTTPKARKPLARNFSPGEFLKTEFYRKSSDSQENLNPFYS